MKTQHLAGLATTIVLLLASITLVACSPKPSTVPSATAAATQTVAATKTVAATATTTPSAAVASATAAAQTSAAADSTQKTFTKDQLAKYNGKNGNPAYIAVSGVVYDVSNVRQWRSGSHQGYAAGVDLTDAIASAPHGTSVLDNVPVVGKYVG